MHHFYDLVGFRLPWAALRLADARLDVRVQIPELVPYLGLGLPAHLAADPLTVRTVPERDDPAPTAGAPPVLVRVAAGAVWS